MKILRRVLFLLLLLSVPIIVAQDSFFTPSSDEPAIPRGERGEWDGKYIDPGAVIYHEGQFHMLRNGFPNWPAATGIDYWVSDDGMIWEQVSEEPLLASKDIEYAPLAALASSLIVEDDGTWVLYFYTWNKQPGTPQGGEIGRATAPAPEGPWTHDEAPVLTTGGDGEWDGSHVNVPHVIRTDEGYVMYYSAFDAESNQSIGMATSEDGIIWTKYDDPETTEAPFAESDPLLMVDANWEKVGVRQPDVVQVDDQWVMVYRNEGSGSSDMRLGIATSDDGITWTKFADNPVFKASDIPRGNNFWFHNVVYQGDTLYLFIEIGPNPRVSETNIYVATWENPTFGD